jgi:hypothetical protein
MIGIDCRLVMVVVMIVMIVVVYVLAGEAKEVNQSLKGNGVSPIIIWPYLLYIIIFFSEHT